MPKIALDEFGNKKVRPVLGGRASILCYESDPLLWQYRQKKQGSKSYIHRSFNEPDLMLAARRAEETYLALVDAEKPCNVRIKDAIKQFIHVKEEKFASGLITINTVRGVRASLGTAIQMYLIDEKKLEKLSDIKKDTFLGYTLWRSTKAWKLIERDGPQSPPKPSTIKRDLVILRDFYKNFLIPHDYATTIPTLETISVHQDQLNANPPIPLDTDWKEIYQYFNKWSSDLAGINNTARTQFYRQMMRHFVLISYNSGTRPVELLGSLVKQRIPHPEGGWSVEETIKGGLRWCDVEVEPQEHISKTGKSFQFLEAMMYIRESKTGKPREIPTNTGNYFVRWRKFCDEFRKENGLDKIHPNDYVFFNPFTGRPYPYSQVWGTWEQMRTNLSLVLEGSKTGKPYTVYSLRSSYITNQINEGKDVYLIKKITGHSLEILQRHYDRSDLRKRRGEATARTYGATRKENKAIDLSNLDKLDIEGLAKEAGYNVETTYNRKKGKTKLA